MGIVPDNLIGELIRKNSVKVETDDDFMDFEMEAEKVIRQLLPEKSKTMYEKRTKNSRIGVN